MSCKKIIADAMKQLYSKNLISMRDGNISFKPKNKDYFYISAGSVRKNEINEDQVIKVNFRKNNLSYDVSYDINYKYQPSREIHIHSLLQTDPKYFDKDSFIIHAHPPKIISYIGINKSRQLNSIKKIFPEISIKNIGLNVKYHDPGSLDLANNCYKNLIHNDIVGMERHGSLSIGDNIDKLFEDIETLEYYIDIVVKSK